jgi:carboxyl-terminal processing protease
VLKPLKGRSIRFKLELNVSRIINNRNSLFYTSLKRFFQIVQAGLLVLLSQNLYAALSCSELNGAYLFSQESTPTYLGFFGHQLSLESVNNNLGPHGSSIGSSSVRNPLGAYGSSSSALSAANTSAQSPPQIFKWGELIGRLTNNDAVSDGTSQEMADNCEFDALVASNSPGSVANFLASDGLFPDRLELTWDAAEGAAGYDVFFSDSIDGQRFYISSTAETSMTLVGGEPEFIFYLWVLPWNSFGDGSAVGDTGFFAPDFDIDIHSTMEITGLWWNSDESGWGVTLTQQYDVIFATLFTYDDDGAPTWYFASDCRVTANGCSGELYRATGGAEITQDWGDRSIDVEDVGFISFTFVNDAVGQMSYTLNGQSGSRYIIRQEWSTLSPGASMSALWWDKAEPGWGVTLMQQTDIAFATIFSYDSNGEPTWHFASECLVSGESCTGLLYEISGGKPLTQSWDGSDLEFNEVGNIEFSFSDSDNGAIDFTLNAQTAEKTITRQVWATGPASIDPDGWQKGQFLPAIQFESSCANPRGGIDPATQLSYPDVQGLALDENNWLRSWSNDLYLWYDEIADQNPENFQTIEYFDQLKTQLLTPSGNQKDKFHFTYDTEAYRVLSESGVTVSYGATFGIIQASPPREIVVAYTEPDSPATLSPANLLRGARLIELDGVDVVNGNDPDTLNAALFPAGAGETHAFVVQDPGSNETRSFSMTAQEVTSVPVQNVTMLETATGNVGYMQFNDFIRPAEQQLIDAVNQFKAAGITDLVLDLRYNGGGLLAIASQLAYMIAGPVATTGRAFEQIEFNEKHPFFDPVTGQVLDPIPFINTAVGFSATTGLSLPVLNLSRVFVLTGSGTCSASESVINGLRGVDVEVIQIGSTTCGKPYGFYPADNCGTTYFTVQFRGINDKGFGDFTDGFSPANTTLNAGTSVPGCSVADDFTHLLGDSGEGKISAALQYRVDGSCPAASGLSRTRLVSSLPDLSAAEAVIKKSPLQENRILTPELFNRLSHPRLPHPSSRRNESQNLLR